MRRRKQSSETRPKPTCTMGNGQEQEGVEMCLATKGQGLESENGQNFLHKGNSTRILTFVYLVCLIEGLDISLLPASLKALESETGLTPTMLGVLGMSQGVFQSVSGLVWGSMADRGFSRKALICAGTLGWAILTILMGMVNSFGFLFVLRCLNGFALASLGPIVQSVISDVAEPDERGLAFGITQLSWNLGMGVSSIGVTAVSQQQIEILGTHFTGWRVAYVLIGMLSFILFVGLVSFMPEIPRANPSQPRTYTSESKIGALIDEFKLLCSYFSIPSFLVILLQAIFGLVPWAAMSFLIIWLQYLGLSDLASGTVAMCLNFACGLGGPIGGAVGDRLSKWSRFHGRPLTAQISVSSGIVIFLIILVLLPKQLHTLPVFAGLITVFGLTASWAGVGCNSPLLLELVEENSKSRVIALLNAISGAASAMFGGPVVGMLAEVMGYKVSEGVGMDQMLPVEREQNSQALTYALVAGILPPWVMCLLGFTLLHWTYERDVLRLQAQNQDAKEAAGEAMTDSLIAEKGAKAEKKNTNLKVEQNGAKEEEMQLIAEKTAKVEQPGADKEEEQ